MRHEVAIYTTSSATAGLYDRSHGRAGGAERQMTLLARALAESRHRVAHIVYPAREPVALSYPLTLVHRDPYAGGRRVVGGPLEARAVWRALRDADAAVVVVRTASPLVGVVAMFCKLRRRSLIFSSSNISDFTVEMASRLNRALYRLGVRLADAVVVQSEDQRDLALQAFPSLRRIVQIPSFAEVARTLTPHDGSGSGAFLWFGRAVPQKQPQQYVELARSFPEARFLMIAVPDGRDSRFLQDLRDAAREVANLELVDPLPHARLTDLIARSVAVVNTSTLEGMPNAFLEAWACGVPVLTLQFDPDGIVARGELGVAAGGSWDRFVAGARTLWESRSEREELSRRVRAHVEEAHSSRAVAARWGGLIAELRHGASQRRPRD